MAFGLVLRQRVVFVALLDALPVLRAADHEPIEPARERRLEAKLPETARELDARELCDVLGVGRVTTPFPREAVDGVVMQIAERGERCRISSLCTTYEVLILPALLLQPSIGRRGSAFPWNRPGPRSRVRPRSWTVRPGSPGPVGARGNP